MNTHTSISVFTAALVLLLSLPFSGLRAQNAGSTQSAGSGKDTAAVTSTEAATSVVSAVAPPLRSIEERVSRAVSVWERQVSLSRSQKESIAARATAFIAEREGIKSDTALTFSEKVRLISASHERYLTDVRTLLTQSQRTALEARKAQLATLAAGKTAGRKEEGQ